MGAKTGLFACTSAASVGDVLRGRPVDAGGDAAAAFVGRLYPGWRVEPDGGGVLNASVYPPAGVVCAVSFPGLDMVCDGNVMLDRPSELPARYLEVAGGRTVLLHAMHSVVDWLAFAVWRDGVLVRSLSLSPGSGVMEDIGEPFPFEARFWAGECPVEPDPGWANPVPYPLLFHPLELGEEALRELFGFVMEGFPEPDDVDADEISVHRFRIHGSVGGSAW